MQFAAFADAPASLLEARALLRRIDTKYILPAAELVGLFHGLEEHYAAVGMHTGRCQTYKSLYFDTPELRCFHDHRRGRRPRNKVRVRHYQERELSVLEVKTKRNELVTHKHRLAVPFGSEVLGEPELAFVQEHTGLTGLVPVARIDYTRITLLSLNTSERVTIDVDMTAYDLEGSPRSFGEIGIVEIKQSVVSRSEMMRRLSSLHFRQLDLSKYAAAIAVLRPDERMNRLLPQLRALQLKP